MGDDGGGDDVRGGDDEDHDHDHGIDRVVEAG
jgi:hypothetical protein